MVLILDRSGQRHRLVSTERAESLSQSDLFWKRLRFLQYRSGAKPTGVSLGKHSPSPWTSVACWIVKSLTKLSFRFFFFRDWGGGKGGIFGEVCGISLFGTRSKTLKPNMSLAQSHVLELGFYSMVLQTMYKYSVYTPRWMNARRTRTRKSFEIHLASFDHNLLDGQLKLSISGKAMVLSSGTAIQQKQDFHEFYFPYLVPGALCSNCEKTRILWGCYEAFSFMPNWIC